LTFFPSRLKTLRFNRRFFLFPPCTFPVLISRARLYLAVPPSHYQPNALKLLRLRPPNVYSDHSGPWMLRSSTKRIALVSLFVLPDFPLVSVTIRRVFLSLFSVVAVLLSSCPYVSPPLRFFSTPATESACSSMALLSTRFKRQFARQRLRSAVPTNFVHSKS